MRYSGRIISLLIVAISSLGLIIYNFATNGHLDMIHIIVSIFYIFFGWWLGKQYDKVKYYSEKDLLTECYNRRFVKNIFPKLKSQSDRNSEKFVVFIIDVDDFKSINDLHDHAMGDRVLQLISHVLTNTFRRTDYVARWGGDEFLVLLPYADELGMNELQNRLHNDLNTLSNVGSLEVSVSVGYAIYPDEGNGLNDLIKVADRKMYSEKRGKDGKLKGV
ncbi:MULTISPECIES: GGDEF domain-containing protein [unclassified Paenibacillus]|uniref:GGDEF domain-containing protein n=1 Tax=unclassified Paenibacillus TaxID=185978 RepID=UPI0030FC497C